MSLSARIAVLLFFFSLCAGGAILASMDRVKGRPENSHATPVINQEPRERIWLQV